MDSPFSLKDREKFLRIFVNSGEMSVERIFLNCPLQKPLEGGREWSLPPRERPWDLTLRATVSPVASLLKSSWPGFLIISTPVSQ